MPFPKDIAELLFSYVDDEIYLNIKYFLNWSLRDPYFSRHIQALGPVYDANMRPAYANWMSGLCTLHCLDDGKLHPVGKVEIYYTHKFLNFNMDERRITGLLLLPSLRYTIGDRLHAKSFPVCQISHSHVFSHDWNKTFRMETNEFIDYTSEIYSKLISKSISKFVMVHFQLPHPGVYPFSVLQNILNNVDITPIKSSVQAGRSCSFI